MPRVTPDEGPADAASTPQFPSASPEAAANYVVVARRYRPQTFDELIGQQHVARALKGAIESGRVGHAYLFTGARGVGKTSAARILAKALDCVHGPTPTPCNVCDICQSISAGSDVDVLEIDGASNRGIDEIRQLRQNVNIRPSRTRYKIYIIDEVHMLTREAFNALLKTLEEPPEHVKFIFCTTEAGKIPITILSRCQRFDFAGIRAPSIADRLKQIAESEGVEAEPEALAMLARRANGSMRDSQSLFEQLLATGQKKITAADLHAMLGTAGESRLAELVGHIAKRDARGALAALDAAVTEGVDMGQLLEQLLGYLRDAMAAAAGCGADSFLYSSQEQQQQIVETSGQLGLETILAMMQIVEESLTRLRRTNQSRTVAETAIVRLCSLADLEELSQLIARLRAGAPVGDTPADTQVTSPTARSAKKKGDDVGRADTPGAVAAHTAPSSLGTDDSSAQIVWQQAIAQLSDLLAENASHAERIVFRGPDRLAAEFPAKYNLCKTFCGHPEQLKQLEQAVAAATGRAIAIELSSSADQPTAVPVRHSPAAAQRKRMVEAAEHPVVRRACELFQAHVTRVDDAGR